jgi:hypothetical protein
VVVPPDNLRLLEGDSIGAIFDVHEMLDETLERVVFGQPVRLPNMSKLERNRPLTLVPRVIVDTSAAKELGKAERRKNGRTSPDRKFASPNSNRDDVPGAAP